MPFGLTNVPTIFQHMENDIFRDLLDVCLIIYLDDLLIYSKTQEEHDSHVLLVLKRLREHSLYAKFLPQVYTYLLKAYFSSHTAYKERVVVCLV